MNIQFLTLCNSSYFCGSPLPVVQVMVDNKTTLGDVKTQLTEYQATDHLEGLDEVEYKVAVEEYFVGMKLKQKVDAGLDSMDDCEEYECYVYFAIEDSGLECF